MEIMRPSSLLFGKVSCLFGFLFLASITGGMAADLVLQKVTPVTTKQAAVYPENVARYYLGAQLEVMPQRTSIASLQLSSKSEDTNTAEVALLCDDPTVGYPLSTGTTTLVVSLPAIENIDTISLVNRGTKGTLDIAVASAELSADSSQWHDISQQDVDGETVKARIGPSDAKYVRLTFKVKNAGRIADLGIYSTTSVSDFMAPRLHNVNLQESSSRTIINYNVTNLHSTCRVLYVSSGDALSEANEMMDDQPTTAFTFASSDKSPTVIVDLGKVVPLRRISALYSRRQGKLDVYFLPSLPGSQIGQQSLKLDAKTLTELQPVGSVMDEGRGYASVDFPATAGRYMMLKWTPAGQGDHVFSVAELAAFSGSEPPNLIAANVSSTRREDISSNDFDGKDFGDPKDFAEGKDFKEAKEAPAEAPAEGPVSPLPAPPPFTFIPVVTPVSP